MRPLVPTLLAASLTALSGAVLEAQRPVPLDTVHVRAGSRLIAGAAALTRSVDVLDRAAIDALPAHTIGAAIARALGTDLLARSPAQADLSIRGSSFEQILVLVDGIPVNDRQTGHFHLDLAVPIDAVERIEVLRGPASALYGSSAVGGVVNIVTRSADSGVGARAQGGSFGAFAFAADAAGTTGGVSGRLSAEHDAADGHRAGTDHRHTLAHAAVAVALAGGEIRAQAGYAARDFGASDFYAPFDSYEETRTATASISAHTRPAAIVIAPRISVRRHEDDFILRRDDPAFYHNMHTTMESDAELVARWFARPQLAIAAGAEAGRSDIESNSLGDRSFERLAAFAEVAAGDASSALLTVGARFDHNSDFGSFGSASAAAGYRVSPGLLVRASAASGFRAPSWTDRFYRDPANIGSPDLDPERFWTVELGTGLNTRGVSVDVAGFVRRAHDLIDWGRARTEPDSTPWRTLNVERATFRGLEAAVITRLGPVSLTGRGTLLSFDATESDGFVSKYALQPLTRSASLEAALPLTHFAHFAMRGFTARRADGTVWQQLDARASVTAGGVQLFADATNLLDAAWLDVSARPAAGRAFIFGLRARR